MVKNKLDPASLTFRHAVAADAVAIAELVNSAYRGESSKQGWTTEADLLQGQRINAQEVQTIIATDGSVIFLCLHENTMIGCVNLERTGDAAYLGLFVVRPDLQGANIGKTFMQTAEAEAQKLWGVKKMWMTVISIRKELLAYYQRRGYVITGEISDFPFANDKEIALVENLQFEHLEKILPAIT
jgi:GNAT superfamily N-acetyltransferase